jgi:hypothetical protein
MPSRVWASDDRIHGDVSSSIHRFVVGASVVVPPRNAKLFGQTVGLHAQVAEPSEPSVLLEDTARAYA